MVAAAPLLAGSLFAQEEQIPDGKFEYWKTGTTDAGTSYDDLANPFWESLNILSSLPPDMFTGPVTLFKDKGRSGEAEDFAPRMESKEMAYGDGETIFLPGVVGAMHVLIETQTAVFGKPFTSRPAAIKGYMKYAPKNGDSASIFVELYKYNADLGKRIMIGRVEKIYTETVSEWTEFNLPITYNSAQAPDSVTVLFVSSAGYDFDNLFACKGQVGSSLWVDDVEFVYGEESAVETADVLRDSKLYPNPSADGRFHLQVPEACRIEVVSLSGAVVFSRTFGSAGTYSLDLSDRSQGIYMVRLSNENGTTVLKAVCR